MGIGKEFRDFAMRGNVIDLAVGVIIGGAFGRIVSSLVEKILMPPLGLLIGGVDLSQARWVMKPAGLDGKGEVAIGYGDFAQAMVNFLIIAGAIFLLLKGLNALMRQATREGTVPAAAPPESTLLLREIRDSLGSRSRSSP